MSVPLRTARRTSARAGGAAGLLRRPWCAAGPSRCPGPSWFPVVAADAWIRPAPARPARAPWPDRRRRAAPTRRRSRSPGRRRPARRAQPTRDRRRRGTRRRCRGRDPCGADVRRRGDRRRCYAGPAVGTAGPSLPGTCAGAEPGDMVPPGRAARAGRRPRRAGSHAGTLIVPRSRPHSPDHGPRRARLPGGRNEMPDGLHPTTESTAPAAPGEALSRALADPASAWPDVVLREHQLEALDELARSRLSHGVTRTWVDAPTGSGKTDHVPRPGRGPRRQHPRAGAAAQPGRPDRRRARAPLPRRSASHPEGPTSAGQPGVAICTYQAALRHQERMDWDSVTLLICDEAHATLGAQTRRLLDRADERGRRGLHRDRRDHHRARGAGLRPGRHHARPHLGDRARHPLPAALAARRAGGRPLRRRQGARRLRPGLPGPGARPRQVAPRLRRGLGRALRSPSAMAGVAYTATVAQAHGLAEEFAGARGAGRGGVGPDPGARAAAGAVRLRLRPHRRALQRRPAHRGLGRDPRLGGHAPGARPPPSASSCSAWGA